MARSVNMYGMGWDRLSDIAIASREAKAGLLVCVLDQSCVSSEPCYVMLRLLATIHTDILGLLL